MKLLGEVERNGDVVHPKLMQALRTVDFIHRTYTNREVEVPHLMDGKHKKGSRHYVGLAADIRIWYVPAARLQEFTKFVASQLGADFDVVLESNHLHIEYDPKYPSL